MNRSPWSSPAREANASWDSSPTNSWAKGATPISDRYRFGGIVGKSESMQAVYDLILDTADGGTLFLDEIGEIAQAMQVVGIPTGCPYGGPWPDWDTTMLLSGWPPRM